jgi:hypothetical protein
MMAEIQTTPKIKSNHGFHGSQTPHFDDKFHGRSEIHPPKSQGTVAEIQNAWNEISDSEVPNMGGHQWRYPMATKTLGRKWG